MDQQSKASEAPTPAAPQRPVMDVVAPPTEPAPEQAPEPEKPAEQPHHPPVAKTHSNSVTAAIVATVIIVLGLAGLAVFAYLQST